MLSKKYRLTKNGSFTYLYTHGQRSSSGTLKLSFVKSKSGIRIGFSVSNKIGKAVVRNKVKRRMRAIAAEALPTLKSCQAVFIALPGIDALSYAELREKMLALFDGAGLVRR